jgi:hypothetical protein
MDKSELIHKRKGRYMAQFLEFFEEKIEPLVSKEVSDEVKAMGRRKFNALATDACEIAELKADEAMNGLALEMKDRLHPDAAPTREGVTS